MEQIGNLFISIDDEYAGHITREGLAAVVSAAATCWEPEFDVDDFFDAADQDDVRAQNLQYCARAMDCGSAFGQCCRHCHGCGWDCGCGGGCG